MTTLIAYATIEGQTGKVARFVEDWLVKIGHKAELFDVSSDTNPITFSDYDTVILAAPVHERRHPEAFETFLSAHKDELADSKTMMLSVSLSAAFPEGGDEAKDYLDEMKMRTGLAPDAECLVAGAVRTRNYDYYAMQVLRHVVLRGKSVDQSVDEHEFTDWHALRWALADFMEDEMVPS